MLYDFAQHLHSMREVVISRWLDAVRADERLVTANRLEESELRDHLGSLLSRLAETLAASNDSEDPQLAPGTRQDANVHGHTRWLQDYRVDELVREIALLRSELLGFFSEYLKQRRQIETNAFLETTQLVHRFFDEICMTSVSRYVNDREQQVEVTQRGLRLLNEELEKQFHSADHTRRQTLSTVAHEMATPVNALGLGVTYLAESEDPQERREAKQLIGRTLDHLRTMLDQLLDFARAEGSLEKVRVSNFQMRPLFEYLIAGFEPLAGGRDLQFSATLDDALVSVISDENKVQRIAVNLLSNAIKYTDSGSVALTLRGVDADRWLIEVKDTGCGVPPEDLARIFAEFQRLPQHNNRPGLGIGLSIVRTLAERLGGTVEVESEVGQGSCFRVFLPRRI